MKGFYQSKTATIEAVFTRIYIEPMESLVEDRSINDDDDPIQGIEHYFQRFIEQNETDRLIEIIEEFSF